MYRTIDCTDSTEIDRVLWFFSESTYAGLYSEAPRSIRLRTDYTREEVRPWDHETLVLMLKKLPHLKDVHMDNALFEYHTLVHLLQALPKLTKLTLTLSPETVHLNRTRDPKTSLQSFHSISSGLTTSVNDITITNLAWYELDKPVDLTLLSFGTLFRLPTVKRYCLDIGTWCSLVRIKISHSKNGLIGFDGPPQLQELVIYSKEYIEDGDLANEAHVKALFRQLHACREHLIVFHLLVSYQLPVNTKPNSKELDKIVFRRLEQFLGPLSLQRLLAFPDTVHTIWNTAPGRILTGPGVRDLIGEPTRFTQLRYLSVGFWDLKMSPLSAVLANVPELAEISFSTTALEDQKEIEDLAKEFTSCPSLRAVSVLSTTAGHPLPSKGVSEVLACWVNRLSKLDYVRLDPYRFWSRKHGVVAGEEWETNVDTSRQCFVPTAMTSM
ncbi:hypothetical protein V5O48_015848 [Marasmius crinis-equi]|uniref:F-box domain-containing protein n=1 Tax=Marasmius crinis-equi TaxID=585013 RepID=A0ABR3ETF0_9AGAR